MNLSNNLNSSIKNIVNKIDNNYSNKSHDIMNLYIHNETKLKDKDI